MLIIIDVVNEYIVETELYNYFIKKKVALKLVMSNARAFGAQGSDARAPNARALLIIGLNKFASS
jgi:hypothetical protein